jgi:hypothetical protein
MSFCHSQGIGLPYKQHLHASELGNSGEVLDTCGKVCLHQ